MYNQTEYTRINSSLAINAGFPSWGTWTQIINCICSAAAAAKSLQSCPTLCSPIDGSPTGPAIPGIL